MMAMANSKIPGIASLLLLLFQVLSASITNDIKPPLRPAMFMFGDSIFDVGNNNINFFTSTKANYLPYGRDFVNQQPTGRFCNGKLAIDFVAETLGFTRYQPAYLSEEARGKNLAIGANFASASSGYYDNTAAMYHTIPLSQQLVYYKEYRMKLARSVGKSLAIKIIRNGIYLISAGSSDFLQNYYINPLINVFYTPEQFSAILAESFSDAVKTLYRVSAKKFGVVSLPPLGCLPVSMTLFGDGTGKCVTRLNTDAIIFNKRLNSTAHELRTMLNITLVFFDIYTPLYKLSTRPEDQGFSDAKRSCCVIGQGSTPFTCDVNSWTCLNATEYVFWDGVHPTQAANEILAADLMAAGLPLITN